jgi:hypothetical protein
MQNTVHEYNGLTFTHKSCEVKLFVHALFSSLKECKNTNSMFTCMLHVNTMIVNVPHGFDRFPFVS